MPIMISNAMRVCAKFLRKWAKLKCRMPKMKKPRMGGGRGFSEFSMHGNGGRWGPPTRPDITKV